MTEGLQFCLSIFATDTTSSHSISKILETQPTNEWSDEDNAISYYEYFNTTTTEEISFEESLERFLTLLESKKESILKITSAFDTVITCIWYSEAPLPSFKLKSGIVKRCANLDLCLKFEFCLNAEQEEYMYCIKSGKHNTLPLAVTTDWQTEEIISF